MQKITMAVTLLLMAFAIGCSRRPEADQANATPTNATPTNATLINATPPSVINCAAAEKGSNFPPIPNTIDSTCAVIPADMNGTGDTQPGPDLYSWPTFVAVNWPVDPTTCDGNAKASILNSPPDPVWLSYLSDDDIFVASGSPAGRIRPTNQTAETRQSVIGNFRLDHKPVQLFELSQLCAGLSRVCLGLQFCDQCKAMRET